MMWMLVCKIGITSTLLADIELGTKGFSIKRLYRFCDVLKMPTEAILYGPKEHIGIKYASVLELLERCPEEKRKHAEEVLVLFLLSHDPIE